MTNQKLAGILFAVVAGAAILLCAGAGDDAGTKPAYKSVFVPSVPVAAKQLGDSEVEVDGPRFAKDVDAAIAKLAQEGFQVVSTIPMISGMYRWSSDQPIQRSQSASASSYGYGYSVTAGVTIVARRG